MNITFLTDNDEVKQKVALFLKEWNNEHVFFSVKTSGSTGKPKVIEVKKEFAIQSSKNTGLKFNLQQNQNALLCLDSDTIAGKMMIVRSLILKLNLFIVEPSANPFLSLDKKIDFVALVPLQLQAILSTNPEALAEISHVIVGGGAISQALEMQLTEHKITVYQTYGMTETITHIALRKMGYESDEFFETLPNIEISEEDKRLKINAPEIGVVNLLTNDIVEIQDSNHFKWLGRADFVVNSGGIKIHPEQLKAKLESQITEAFFLCGVSDEKFGEKVIIVIESDPQEKYCLKEFYSTLAKFERPKEAWFISKFPLTLSSKINQAETLKSIHASGIREIL